MAPYAQHAEELSRAISEINLNAQRELATTLHVRSTQVQDQGIYDHSDENHDPGASTPNLPGAPPPTPATPGHSAPGKEVLAVIPPLTELDEEAVLQPIENQQVPKAERAPLPFSAAAEDRAGNTDTIGEPDEAVKIRRQIEYYFSDANLMSDTFLQLKTEGLKKPIKLQIIAGFGRMRQFRPYSAIVAALQDSVSLHVAGADGEETIERKKPYDPKNLLSREETYTDIEKFPKSFDEESFALKVKNQPQEKKGKHKRSSGVNKTKKPPPNGFEEFYADAPMTPDEAFDEIHYVYSSDRPFHERMQSCIQNYRAKRKLDEKKANIFTQYLILGGVEASSKKQFTGGLDKDVLEESTAGEIRSFQATDFIRGSTNSKYYDPTNSKHWVVDFSGVVAGFFSQNYPDNIGYATTSDVQLACGVVKNFLNYILYHSVCPEFTEDIMSARRICDQAEDELPALTKILSMLPGDYNMAASTLWGGQYENAYFEPSENATWLQLSRFGMHPKDAERLFNVCIGLTGTQDQYLAVMKSPPRVLQIRKRAFEVVEMERATIQTIEQYAGMKDRHGKAGTLKPLGLLKVKPWEGPCLQPEDSTDDGESALLSSEIETFWLDDSILQHCFIGFKMVCTVHELEHGIRYFDSVMGLYCSFFTLLENSKMKSWKAPVPHTRPPPTEDDVDAEEAELNDFGEL
ncbi:argonaute siRNA chaperone complex subunit Arb1 [Phlyctema vagabunda]|uniref:Argonaute siRNA chaperone complex subunit Arb1 n=1 Tax=Phlyctema vagabunda TaxID=108571 RepID=A0ABR4PVJ2_9HELO